MGSVTLLLLFLIACTHFLTDTRVSLIWLVAHKTFELCNMFDYVCE